MFDGIPCYLEFFPTSAIRLHWVSGQTTEEMSGNFKSISSRSLTVLVFFWSILCHMFASLCFLLELSLGKMPLSIVQEGYGVPYGENTC